MFSGLVLERMQNSDLSPLNLGHSTVVLMDPNKMELVISR